jgi:hypothetical protein
MSTSGLIAAAAAYSNYEEYIPPPVISFHSHTIDSSNMNITVPSTIEEGDLAIAYSTTATGPAPTLYSGFTQIASLNSTFEDMFQYKIFDGTEGGTTLTRTGDSYDAASLLVFRSTTGADTVWSLDQNNTSIVQTSSTPTTVNLTLPTVAPTIIFANYSAYSSMPYISGTFWDADFQNTGESSNRIHFYYEIQNTEADLAARSIVPSGDYGSYNRLSYAVFSATRA